LLILACAQSSHANDCPCGGVKGEILQVGSGIEENEETNVCSFFLFSLFRFLVDLLMDECFLFLFFWMGD
jgi:hypothetical protein